MPKMFYVDPDQVKRAVEKAKMQTVVVDLTKPRQPVGIQYSERLRFLRKLYKNTGIEGLLRELGLDASDPASYDNPDVRAVIGDELANDMQEVCRLKRLGVKIDGRFKAAKVG